MEQEEEQRNWTELDEDILVVIFRMVGIIDVLKSAEPVCRAWQKVAKGKPELWSRIDLMKIDYKYKHVNLMNLVKIAIDRSRGKLQAFSMMSLAYNDFLQYLCDKTSVLKSLRLICCYNISDEGVLELVKRQPLLEELDLKFGYFNYKLPELIGKQLPNLKQFKWCRYCLKNEEDKDETFGIAKTMHKLRHLQIACSRLSNEGLKAILEWCRHLETLDIRGCIGIKMDSYMLARCVRLMTSRLIMCPPPSICLG